ncbi:MAG: hypothetical protein Q4C95_03580 [Planctomycetia bacterium]|nr:hypothetical protein [Planctomycetia bacterium]
MLREINGLNGIRVDQFQTNQEWQFQPNPERTTNFVFINHSIRIAWVAIQDSQRLQRD